MPVINRGDDYFAVVTYTGNGTSQTISGLRFQPDFVWIKGRSGATDHALYDAQRGVQSRLESNTTDAQVTSDNGVTAFNSDGFSIGSLAQVNTNGATYVAWCWKEGATQGFDIVTYTGTGANQSIAHNLGVAPSMLIVKRRNSTGDWPVQHRSVSASNILWLNLTNAQTASSTFQQTYPTSSVFYIDGGNTNVGANGSTYVAYLFAEVAGFSKFGTWQNNNSTDGTFIYLGFRPRFILLKNYDNVEGWFIWDSARQTYNMAPPSNNWLNPNLSNAEGANNASTAEIDGLSNGFKIRTTNPATGEVSFGTRNYIYAAFAEHPFKNALAR